MMEKKAPEEEVERLLSEGWELRNSGELEKALQCFDRATKIAPHNPDAWSNKGCILEEIADNKRMMTHEDAAKTFRKALKCFDRALKISPNDGVLWSNKGKALLMLGKKEEGLDCYDRSTELEPESSMLWLNRGLAYLMFEYFADALRYFDRAVELDPGNREAWVQKYLIHKRWDEMFDAGGCLDMIERIDRIEEMRKLGIEPEIKQRRVKGEASKVVFISIEDPTLCLMARAIFKHMARISTAEGAVSHPKKEGADPLAVQVMEEIGIELSEESLIDFFEIPQHEFDCAVSFGHLRIVDRSDPGFFREWPVVDLLRGDVESYRAVRDELRSRIEQLLEELGG